MKRKTIMRTAALAAMAGSLALTSFAQVGFAGRQLDNFGGVTAVVPVPSIGGLEFGTAPVNGIFWDVRCANVEYTFNSFQGANVGSPAEISVPDLIDAVQIGLDRWNDNPSSYIEMNITESRDLGDRPRGFDFINEVTFITAPGFGALASSPSTSLDTDTTFVAGDDIDGDGDSDVFDYVAEGVSNTCQDIDGDGDIEFPAGDYLAGTILENDVQFSETFPWELEPTDSPTAADVDAVSTHEFGHSHGLNHALNNQISSTDGTGTTMFPFIDVTDAASEFGSRTPHVDDLANSAFIYQEGSAATGIAALQEGDVAFDEAYNVVTGSVVDGAGNPIAGAHIQMIDVATGEALTEAYSGTTQVFIDVNGFAGGGAFAFDEAVIDGNFAVPVPADRPAFRAVVQMLDGDPAATGNISVNAIIGGIVHGTEFPEEAFSGPLESANEPPIALSSPVLTVGEGTEVDFILNDQLNFTNLDAIQFGTTGFFAGETQFTQVQSFDGATILGILNAGFDLKRVEIQTGPFDASLVPNFDRVRLAVGQADPATGDLVITQVIQGFSNVEGQDGDHIPIDIRAFRRIPFTLTRALRNNPDADLLIIAEVTDGEIGPSGFPAELIPLSTNPALDGDGFVSINGDTPFLTGFTFDMRLGFFAQ